jgi:hypothetical protein
MSHNITVSDEVYTNLQAAAQARGVSVEALLIEFTRQLSAPPTTHSKELEALAAGGLPSSFPRAFADLIDPTLDYDAIRRDLAGRTFSPLLSEIIIEDRG